MKRLSGTARTVGLCAALIGTSTPAFNASAAPLTTHEVVISRVFDGTETFDADPLDDGLGAHTEGLDASDTNYVVRTYDGFGVRVDWNTNENAATNLTAIVTLNIADSVPTTTATLQTPPGDMFAGCDQAKSSISDDKLVLTCVLGDFPEGTKGAFFPTYFLAGGQDGTALSVDVKLTSDEVPNGPTSTLSNPFIVSEVPAGDWYKSSSFQGRLYSTPGDPSTATRGFVQFFPLALAAKSLAAAGGEKGSGELSAQEVTVYDHLYAPPPGAKQATQAQLREAGFSGPGCGALDAGNDVPFPVNPEVTVTCTPVRDNYPVTAITVTPSAAIAGQPWSAPVSNVNGSPNTRGIVATAQIAYFIPVSSEIYLDKFVNAVSGKAAAVTSVDDIVAPPVDADGHTDSSTTDNQTSFGFATGGGGGGGGVSILKREVVHSAYFSDPVNWETKVFPGGPDDGFATTPNGGAIQFIEGSTGLQSGNKKRYWSGNSIVSRGYPLRMDLLLATANEDPQAENLPLHGCMVWDNTQVQLTPFGELQSVDPATGEATTLTPGKFEMLNYGFMPPSTATERSGAGPAIAPNLKGPFFASFVDDARASQVEIVVEYARDNAAFTDSVAINSTECNDSGREWVNPNDPTVDLSAYEVAGRPGVYDFNMMRVRVLGDFFPWYSPYGGAPEVMTSGILVSVSGVTGLDFNDVNKDDTVIRLHSSRGIGKWNDAAGAPTRTPTCYPNDSSNNREIFLDEAIPSGRAVQWCNQPYNADGEIPVDSVDFKFTADLSAISKFVPTGTSSVISQNEGGTVLDADSDRLTIKAVRPWSKKVNQNGLFDITDNGDQVQFDLQMKAIGSTVEALGSVVFVDYLPDEYKFVEIVKAPTTPGSTCEYYPRGTYTAPNATEPSVKNAIVCVMSEPDPLNPVPGSQLPLGLPGGWEDSVTVLIEVSGAVAAATENIPLVNELSLISTVVGPWDTDTGNFTSTNDRTQTGDSSATSYLPYASYDSRITKLVGEGDVCTFDPRADTSSGPLAEVCKATELDRDPSNLTTPDDVGNLRFALQYTNQGSALETDLRIIDVFSYNGDSSEPASNSGNDGADPSTLGDGRNPASAFVGDIGFVSATADLDGAPLTSAVVLVSADDPTTISRDPNASIDVAAPANSANTWCDLAGNVVYGAGACPADPFSVTAVMVEAGDVLPSSTVTVQMVQDTENAGCTDVYANTFGARSSTTVLPIRSNDVFFEVKCEFDLALQKRVGANWKPAADWITYGESTVDFEIEVINQLDPIEDFDVTDYVDPIFKFVAADNPAGTTKPGSLGSAATGPALPYTWSGGDGATKPVVTIKGGLDTGESVIIPIRLRVVALDNTFVNNAEISRFDSDGDPANGDSATPSAGGLLLTDIDSTPDDILDNDVLIDDAIDLTPETGDEDDADIAEVPWYDLSLVKDLADGQQRVITFNGETADVNFVIKVKNQSLLPVTKVDVIDVPPAGMVYAKSNPTGTVSIDGADVTYNGAGTFQIASMAPDQEVTIPVTYTMTATAAVGGSLINNAEIFGFLDANGVAQPDVDSKPDKDQTNDAYADPEGGAEADGGESPDFDADGDGDLHDRNTIDEDDQDREVVEVRYSLGNQVWIDSNNDGLVSTGEDVKPGVKMLLFTDANGDGLADDANGDGKITEADARATTTTDDKGLYLFSDLVAGSYVVGVAASNWDVGGPLEFYRSSDPTQADPNTDIDQDDNGIVDAANKMVISGAVKIGPAEPVKEAGPDNDSNADILSNLTVDFGFYVPDFDLALRKVVVGDIQVQPGTVKEFKITVFNQGTVTAKDIEIVDYLPSGLRLSDENWTEGTDGRVYRKIPGTLAPGETIDVSIFLTVTKTSDLDNYAEIAQQTPIDANGDTLVFPNGNVVPDIDSTPDDVQDDILIDDEIDLTPETGDEDDHDIASLIGITPPDVVTGMDARWFFSAGLVLFGLGAFAQLLTRRRRAVTAS